MVEDILGACYKFDVLNNDRKGLETFISSPYVQGFRSEMAGMLSQYLGASKQCFISRKFAEYIQLLLK